MLDGFIGNSNKKYRFVKKIDKGCSATVYIVSDYEDIFILKIPYNEQAFIKEKIMLQELEKNNFPDPLMRDEVLINNKKGIIMSFINGNNGNDIILDKKNIRRLIDLINKFQNIDLTINEITVYDVNLLKRICNKNLLIIES